MNRSDLAARLIALRNNHLSIHFLSLIFIFIAATSNLSAQNKSYVMVQARGITGEESMRLVINDQVIHTWENLSNNENCLKKYKLYIYEPMTIESIRFESVNFEGHHGIQVNRIEIDGVEFQTEADNTLSYGSWSDELECSEGYKKSEWIDCPNGWFEYQGAVGMKLAYKEQVDSDLVDIEVEHCTDSKLTGISEIDAQAIDVSVYPNPFAEDLNINFANQALDQVQLQIYNSAGALVQKEILRNVENRINLNHLESGNYYFCVVNDKGVLDRGQLVKM